MQQQVSQEALLALELFRLAPSSKRSRGLMEQHLIETSMYVYPEARMASEIEKACSDLLGQPGGISEAECREAIDRCCDLGRIHKKSSGKYVLSEIAANELKSQSDKFREAEEAFNTGLVEHVGRALSTVLNPIVEPLLCTIVRDAIQGVFYSDSIRLQSRLLSGHDVMSTLSRESDIEQELLRKLATFAAIQTDATPDKAISGIRALLGSLNEKQRHYIGNLQRRVSYFQILNIDPRLQDIEQRSFSAMHIYLDTNVAIRYLCVGAELHDPITDILNASKALGAKLYVSPITLRESQRLVEDALRFSLYLKDGRITRIIQASPTAVNNPIIDGFIRERRNRASLNWEAYVSPMANLAEYLFSHDVLVEEEGFQDIENDEMYSNVYRAVSEVKIDRTQNVLSHDASNFVLVQRLRSRYPGTPLGSSVFLLTMDTRLAVLDRRLRRRYRIPHCRLLEQWGEVLLNFQNVGKFIARDEYVAYLASQSLGVYIPEEALDMHIFDSLTNSEVINDAILDMEPEIASGVIRDLQIDREARSSLEQITKVPAEEKAELVSIISEKTKELESKHIHELKEEMDSEGERLRRGISELSDQLRELESARQKDSDSIKYISNKLKSTEKELQAFEAMSFWERLRFLFGR